MKGMKSFLFLAALAVVLVACGPAGPQQVEYTIEMTEFAYSPDTIEVSVGQEVTLHLKNMGALEHELMIGQEVMSMDGQPADFEHNMFENHEPMVMKASDEHADGDEHGSDEHTDGDEHGSDEHAAEGEHSEGGEHADGGHDDMHGFMVSLPGQQPDQVTTLTFTVTEDMVGEWKIGCFLDNGAHYQAGMVGTFIVNP